MEKSVDHLQLVDNSPQVWGGVANVESCSHPPQSLCHHSRLVVELRFCKGFQLCNSEKLIHAQNHCQGIWPIVSLLYSVHGLYVCRLKVDLSGLRYEIWSMVVDFACSDNGWSIDLWIVHLLIIMTLRQFFLGTSVHRDRQLFHLIHDL